MSSNDCSEPADENKSNIKDNDKEPGDWCTPRIPASERQNQEDHKASLGYRVSLCLNKT